MMHRPTSCQAAALVAALGVCLSADALPLGPGDTFTYQAQVKQGDVLLNGNVNIRIGVYDVAAGGVELDFNTFLNVAVTDGLIALDLTFAPGTFNGDDRWLQIELDGAPLTPRQPVLPTPYAMYAQNLGAGGLGATYADPVEFTSAANQFTGNGSGLAQLNASAITTGTVPNSALGGTYSNAVTFTNGMFSGDGGGLTNLDWNALANVPGGFADNIDNDTIYTAVAPLQMAANTLSISGLGASVGEVLTWNGAQATWAADANTTYSAGSGLNLVGTTFSLGAHAHNAADITAGTLNAARMPTGGNWALSSGLNIDSDTLFVNAATNRVGIGTTTPNATLHVAGDIRSAGGLVAYQSGGDFGFQVSRGPSHDRITAWDAQGLVLATGTDPGVTSGRLYVEPDGDVGIGTSDPGARLEVDSSSAQDLFRVADSGALAFVVTDGGNVGVGTLGAPVSARLQVNGFSAQDLFHVIDVGTSAFIVKDGGNVGIGTASPNVNARLHVNGRLQFGTVEYIEDGGTNIASLSASVAPSNDNFFDLGTASFRWDDVFATNGVIQTSDARMKQHVDDLAYGLDELMQLRPVSFEWIDRPEQGTKLGLIAQEVLEVLPEVVKTHDWQQPEDPDAPIELIELERLGMSYTGLVPVLINAAQQQQGIIDAQAAEIIALRAHNDSIEQRLNRLEARLMKE